MPTATGPEQTLKGLLNVSYAKAKVWISANLIVQMAVFITGIIAIFFPAFTLNPSFPPLAIVIACLNVWLSIRATHYKGAAEYLKRQHEALENFGSSPSERVLANMRVQLPDCLHPDLNNLLNQGNTYASVKPVGPVRALENLRESAFFSQHLAAFCYEWLRGIFVFTIVAAIALLLFVVQTFTTTSAQAGAARCVSATLLFVVSVGTLRGWLSFQLKWTPKFGPVVKLNICGSDQRQEDQTDENQIEAKEA